MTTTRGERDLYAEGWAEGVRQARMAVLRSESLGEAVAVLEGLLVSDYRSRKERRQPYLPRYGGSVR